MKLILSEAFKTLVFVILFHNSQHQDSGCLTSQFLCDGGKCLDKALQCDGTVHCRDKTDELNCIDNKCQTGQLQCSNGTCLPASQFCDNSSDCTDGSDESCDFTSLQCKTTEFMCDAETCIPVSWKCDGNVDCKNGLDELDCPDSREASTDCQDCVCLSDGDCSQTCLSGFCVCHDGYTLSLDNRTCNADKPGTMFFIAADGALYFVPRISRGAVSAAQLFYQHSSPFTAFDVIASSGDVIAVASTNIYILSRGGQNGDVTAKLIIKRSHVITSVVVDWINANIYWIENETLIMSNVLYSGLKTLTKDVADVALDPIYNNLYYSTGRGSVLRCAMDVTSCTYVINDPANVVVTLYIDQVSRKIYYSRDNSVYSMSEEGSLHLEANVTTGVSPGPLMYFESFLYSLSNWISNDDNTTPQLYKYDVISQSQRRVNVFVSTNTGAAPISPTAFKISHATLQPTQSTQHPCQTSSCPQLCTQNSPGMATCICSDDFTMTPSGVCTYSGNSCPADLKCVDRSCLAHDNLRCDGFTDCYDDSDESFCNMTCPEHEFKCGVGGCIHGSMRCDAVFDCVDESDEVGCEACSVGFLCGTGRCINSKLVCNEHNDCGDNSDESVDQCGYTPCPDELFECEPNYCIPHSWRCNGYSECTNGTDELDCDSASCVVQCDTRDSGEHRCLPASARCDGIPHCLDGTDEEECDDFSISCHDLEFQCLDNTGCISFLLRCDGVAQCGDGSDEEDCRAECIPGFTRCDNGRCIHPRYLCDGNKDCPLGEDELGCSECDYSEEIQCDGRCLSRTLVCDMVQDCADGRDESDCGYLQCEPSEFVCRTGDCIERHYQCDGSADCSDGSDEENCAYCPVTHFLCGNGVCLTQEEVCDGVDNCGDNTDEQACDMEEMNECLDLMCDTVHGQCVDVRLGYYCQCDPGYQLARNKKHCYDIDECEVGTLRPPACSQVCYNTPGSYVCGCDAGFRLNQDDKSSCDPEDSISLILLSYHSAFVLSRHGALELIPLNLSSTVHAMAVHASPQHWSMLYAAEGENINRYVIGALNDLTVDEDWNVLENQHVSSLAVEWNSGDLYWTDPVLEEIKYLPARRDIEPIKLMTSFCEKARNLVLVPAKGKLYYIHNYHDVPCITQASLDGKGQVRVTGKGEVVSHFDIDQSRFILYYVTESCYSLEHPCLFMRDMTQVQQTPIFLRTDLPGRITSFKVLAGQAYLATDSRDVIRCKLFDDLQCVRVSVMQPHIHDILLYTPLSQPATPSVCDRSTPCVAADMACVSVAADALQPACVCTTPGQVYDEARAKCRDITSNCDSEENFQCKTGGCIELRFRCDGIPDCGDSSDEEGCMTYTCDTVLQFSCRSRDQCVPIERQCDGFRDCRDGSDETSCTGYHLCHVTEFFCPATRTCIPKTWECDGTMDCYHGNAEDEAGCDIKCQFSCLNLARNTQCFQNPEEIQGDGKEDCFYGEDEDSAVSCGAGEFVCRNVLCYPDSWLCDNTMDCGETEGCENCPDGHTLTPDKRCVSQSFMCDGWVDLETGADEVNCGEVACGVGELACRTTQDQISTCIPEEWRCEGWCDLPLYNCSCGPTAKSCGNGQCVETVLWCDGMEDCDNGADEKWCTSPDCRASSFRCAKTHRCLREHIGVCDGANDCLDGSDETLCPIAPVTPCHIGSYDCKSDATVNERCVEEAVCNNETAHQHAMCGNGRDVARCNKGDPCEKNGGCAHTCTPLPDNTRQCGCYHGYQLDSNGRSCRDIDECAHPETCSQVCHNLKGTYTCSCLQGFVKSGHDGSFCKPVSGPPQILISTEFDIRVSTPKSFTKQTTGARQPYRYSFYSGSQASYFYVELYDGVYSLQRLSSMNNTMIKVAELQGPVTDVQYNPLTDNVVYCNPHSVLVLSLSSLLSTTIHTDLAHPVQRISLSPRYGLIFYIRDWTLGSMNSDGSNAHALAADNEDFRTYQAKGGKIVSVSVDEPAKRVFWYNRNLQQLSSVSFAGVRVFTVVNRLKEVRQILVYGDHVYWHTGQALYEVDKRTEDGQGRRRESNLPKSSYISVVEQDDVVKDVCRSCGSGAICRIYSGSGPTCADVSSDTSSSCPCLNGGSCVRQVDGSDTCSCPHGFSGSSCQKKNPSKKFIILASIIVPTVVVIVVYLCLRNFRQIRLSALKTAITSLIPPIFQSSTVRYAKHSDTVSIENLNNVSAPGGDVISDPGMGIVNMGCDAEDYDIQTEDVPRDDQSQLIEDNFAEDVI